MIFQFLYGAIGSFTKKSKILCKNLFQFLYGAIGSIYLGLFFGFNSLFQFLYGAIGRCRQCLEGAVSALISIPIWCDWKFAFLNHIGNSLKFQFLYGAIGRNKDEYPKLKLYDFNSYMVRLEVQLKIFRIKLDIISIPIWCDWKP